MSFEFFVIKHHLLSKNKNAFLSFVAWIAIGGVFVGVAALMVTLAIMTGFQTQFREAILMTNSHIYILEYFAEGMDKWEDLQAEVEKMPSVVSASPFIYAKAMILNGDHVDGIAIRGVRMEDESTVNTLREKNLIAGTFNLKSNPDPKQPGRIVIGTELAKNLEVDVGDTVVLAFPTSANQQMGNIGFKMRRFMVNGIFDSGLYDYNATLCYLSLETAQDFFEMQRKVTGLELRLDDIYQAPLMARLLNGEVIRLSKTEYQEFITQFPQSKAILKESIKKKKDGIYFWSDQLTDDKRELLGEAAITKLETYNQRLDYPYRATDWTEMNQQIFDLLNLQKLVMSLILTLIIVVAAFNVVSTLIMIVMEKTREIGILKAVGAQSGRIMRIFIIEGLIIGVIGSILGTFAGYLIILSLKKWKFVSIAADVYQLDHLPVQLVWSDSLTVLAIAIVISFLATLYPAWQAAKLMPVDAIRYEE